MPAGDLVTVATVAMAFLAVAASAALLPARRVARARPVEILRSS